jgi:predicted phosphoribosyltransferase
MDKEVKRILLEDIDEEVLSKMPEWFRVLKRAYKKRKNLTDDTSIECNGRARTVKRAYG